MAEQEMSEIPAGDMKGNPVSVNSDLQDGDEEIHIRAIHRVIHDRPGRIIGVCFAVSIVLIAIPWVVGLEITDIGNFYARQDPIAEKYDAYTSLAQFKREEQAGNDVQPQQRQALDGFSIIYMVPTSASDRNIFTAKRLDKIKEIETKLQSVPNWSKYCLRVPNLNLTDCAKPLSPVENLGFYDSNGTQVDVPARLNTLANLPENVLLTSGASYFFDREFGPSNPTSKFTRTNLAFGGPLEGYKNIVDQRKRFEQQNKLVSTAEEFDKILSPYRNDTGNSLNDPDLQILYLGAHVTNLEVNRVINADLTLFAISVVIVLAIVMVHTGSQFLAGMAILHIVGSALISLFFYRIVFWFRVMTQQNLLALFIVLGVGADDVFVYKDAWMQSYQAGRQANANMLNRIAWTWNRSATAMLTTSLTSAAAFFATAVNPIPSIRVLGIYTATCILVNFALVITYFPAVVVIWSRKGWEAQCCGKERESPEAAAARLKDVPPEALDPEAGFDMGGQCGTKVQKHTEKLSVKEQRPVERFFHSTYTPFLYRARWAVIAVSLAMVIVGAVYSAQLQVEEGNPSFFPDNYFINVFIRIANERFRAAAQSFVVPVYTVYGIAPPYIDRTGLDANGRLDGTPIFATEKQFNLKSPASQLSVLKTCEEAAKKSLVLQGQVKCFMQAFKEYINETSGTFPVAEGDFVTKLGDFLKVKKYEDQGYPNLVDIKDGRVRYAIVQYNSSMPLVPSYSRMQKDYAAWEAFQKERNADSPDGVNTAYQTTYVWSNMRTQEVLIENALIGVAVSMVLAFFVLVIVSRNLIISALATLSIACVVICMIGFIPLAGLTLGFMESICITVLVGLSVDFVVHLAIAYRDSERATRYERVQDAFTELGVSILGGAATTVCTTSSLFFTTVVLLYRFGQIVLVAILLSFFFANGLFMVLMMMMGPEGETGDLKKWWKRIRGQ